jgi:hypothetical protein
MRRYLVAFGFVLIASAAPALAQTKPPAPPTPGPEHKELQFFIGRWTSEGDMKPGPLGPGGKATGRDSCEPFPGGFQVVCRGEGKGPMGFMRSMGVMTYNPNEKAYTYYGIDSMGGAELATGKKDGNTWTYTAKSNFGGQSFQSRYTIVVTSPKTYDFRWESSPDGSKWSTLFEGKATRTAVARGTGRSSRKPSGN